MRPSARPSLALVLVLALTMLAGCGKEGTTTVTVPALGQPGRAPAAAQKLGFPAFATKNTTRIGGADAIADAAAVAQAVYPAQSPASRPPAVALADSRDWRSALAASVLMSPPIRAPLLLSDGDSLPAATTDALAALRPTGASAATGKGTVIRVGDVPTPAESRTTDIRGATPYALARALDAFATAAAGRPSAAVLVVGAEQAAYAMPAAGWAAKSGDPILFVTRAGIPAPTRAALATHAKPRIYVLGPASAVSVAVARQLARFGPVTRIAGSTPQATAIAFARFADGAFGWHVRNPGHGLVFANPGDPLVAAAAAPLSSSGTYGPLLLVERSGALPPALASYLLDIEPGYDRDPVRGVYNHGWLIGDLRAVSLAAQARIDSLLEIMPVSTK